MKTLLSISIFLLSLCSVNAQVRLISGDLSVLKGQTQVAAQFSYEGTSVGKFDNEMDYVNKKVAELNEKKPGRGDEWKSSWLNDRDNRYIPKFLELISKYTAKKGPLNFQNDPNGTKYTFLINTDFLEPGFNAYVVKKYAEVRMTVRIVESQNPSNEIARLTAFGVGRTYGYGDFDTGTRIAEAYAKAGKDLGIYLTKKVLK